METLQTCKIEEVKESVLKINIYKKIEQGICNQYAAPMAFSCHQREQNPSPQLLGRRFVRAGGGHGGQDGGLGMGWLLEDGMVNW